jgi:hypothetical protein
VGKTSLGRPGWQKTLKRLCGSKIGECGFDSFGSGQEPVASYCEQLLVSEEGLKFHGDRWI